MEPPSTRFTFRIAALGMVLLGLALAAAGIVLLDQAGRAGTEPSAAVNFLVDRVLVPVMATPSEPVPSPARLAGSLRLLLSAVTALGFMLLLVGAWAVARTKERA